MWIEFEVSDSCPSFNYENQSLRLYLTSSKNGVITTKKKTLIQPLKPLPNLTGYAALTWPFGGPEDAGRAEI